MPEWFETQELEKERAPEGARFVVNLGIEIWVVFLKQQKSHGLYVSLIAKYLLTLANGFCYCSTVVRR